MMAEASLRGFLWSEKFETARIDYPRRSAFAVDIAHGTVALPRPTDDDPVNDAVGSFYYALTPTERMILDDRYLPRQESVRVRAERAGLSVRSWYRTIRWLLEECARCLQSKGLM